MPKTRKAYLALISVCFFWGTTYLGIRMALESFPPLALVATRFLISGSLMLAVAAFRGSRLPRGREIDRIADDDRRHDLLREARFAGVVRGAIRAVRANGQGDRAQHDGRNSPLTTHLLTLNI